MFLSLIFVLVLSLVGALLQSASAYTRAGMRRADMSIALENVFAEYHKGMWENYGILAREMRSNTEITGRLEFYGAASMSHDVERIWRLTDGGGQAFYEQAIQMMGGEVSWREEISDSTVEEQAKASEEALEDILQQEDQEMPKEDNPIDTVKELKKSSLLALVHPDAETLSTKTLEVERLASHRELKKGNWADASECAAGIQEKVLFQEYLVSNFSCYSDGKTDGMLEYELEYLLGGAGNDQKNLEKAAGKILLLRLAANYGYLMQDQTKQAEVSAMAATLSTLLTVPGATTVVKQVLLFSWAYGESVVDLRVLFEGKKIPIVKTSDTWQLALSNLAKLGTDDETVSQVDGKKGMDYQGFLRMLLLSEKRETLCMRALDVMEWNLGIRADDCIVGMEIRSSGRQPYIGMDTFRSRFRYD